jgi:hypothetical protein
MAQDIPVPLPVKGIFAQASTAEVSGQIAAELLNWRSNVAELELRRPMEIIGDKTALQRIPFEFGAEPTYIELSTSAAQCRGAVMPRSFDGQAMVAYISGQALIADGKADPFRFDGANFSVSQFDMGGVDVDPAGFDGVIAHHDRPYFWRSNGELEFFYGDVGAVQGALTRYPLGRLGNITGTLVCMVSLSIDAGDNANDALAIITSTGEIVVFEGLDPGDPDTWSLVSRVKVAPPLSRFGFARVGSDVWMMSVSGIVSIGQSLSQGALALVSEFAAPISELILADVGKGSADWQLHMQADGGGVIVNRVRRDPKTLEYSAIQYIYNTAAKGWETANYPARRWHNSGRQTQFTTIAGTGVSASRLAVLGGAEGEIITARWVTGWIRIGRNAHLKSLTPHILGRGPVQVKITVLSDHLTDAAHVAAGTQVFTLRPDNVADAGGYCVMNDTIPIGADGDTFQLQFEVSAAWAKITSLQAGV